MTRRYVPWPTRMLATTLGALLLSSAGGSAWADPPDWAPANGWRDKHERRYDDRYDDDHDRHHRRKDRREDRREFRRPAVGPTGQRWPGDYGVISGRCHRDEIGAVLGAAVGGAVGSRIGEGNGRIVATVVGAIVGGVVGAQIGRSMDEEDRACVGHALELSTNGRPVTWENERNGTRYLLTPLGEDTQGGAPCREFSLDVTANGRTDSSRQRACRGNDGHWNMATR